MAEVARLADACQAPLCLSVSLSLTHTHNHREEVWGCESVVEVARLAAAFQALSSLRAHTVQRPRKAVG